MLRWAGASSCVVGLVSVAGGLCLPSVALAETSTEPESAEVARLELGLGWMGWGGGTGGAGALGASIVPTASTSLALRMAGPAWFVVSAHGSYSDSSHAESDARSSLLGARLGVRLETPVADSVELGGHVLAEGTASSSVFEGSAAGLVSVGAVGGATLHFRPTPLFGVRLSLDVLRAGHQWNDLDGESSKAFYAELTASPQIGLTFTF